MEPKSSLSDYSNLFRVSEFDLKKGSPPSFDAILDASKDYSKSSENSLRIAKEQGLKEGWVSEIETNEYADLLKAMNQVWSDFLPLLEKAETMRQKFGNAQEEFDVKHEKGSDILTKFRLLTDALQQQKRKHGN